MVRRLEGRHAGAMPWLNHNARVPAASAQISCHPVGSLPFRHWLLASEPPSAVLPQNFRA